MYVQLQLVTFFLFCLQGSEQKAVSSASGGDTRVVAGSSGESKNGLHSQGKCYTEL